MRLNSACVKSRSIGYPLPIISGMLDLFNAITGQPAFCASITGIPNPSYEDGYDKQNTELYILFNS